MRTMFFFLFVIWEDQINQLVYNYLISCQRNVAQRERRWIFVSYFLELCWHPIHSLLYRSLKSLAVCVCLCTGHLSACTGKILKK